MKGCRWNNMYNWYIGCMTRSSFWKFRPNFFLGKRLKILEEDFLHFCNLKKREGLGGEGMTGGERYRQPYFPFFVNNSFSMKKTRKKYSSYHSYFPILHVSTIFHYDRTNNKPKKKLRVRSRWWIMMTLCLQKNRPPEKY